MKNKHRKMPPTKLLKQVRNPPKRPSSTGYANSAVYSKNNGASVNVRLDPPMVAMYNCHFLKKKDDHCKDLDKIGSFCKINEYSLLKRNDLVTY